MFVGLVVGLLLVLVAEGVIRLAGGVPNVRDTAELWARQRGRASALADDALILVGSSRIQLGMDLSEIERLSGKRAVQLAIDGSTYLDVLDHLADDSTVTGTLLISSNLRKLYDNGQNERPRQWIAFYDKEYRNLWSPSIEQRLKAYLQSTSALYANLIPIDALGPLLMKQVRLADPYLKTLPSRERNADYSKVRMPDAYVKRVLRQLGHAIPPKTYSNMDEFGRTVIKVAEAHRNEFHFEPEQLRHVEKALQKLKQRGVKVAIIQFPVSGLMEALNDIRYPKQVWDEATAPLSATIIDYRDYPQLRFKLVDGSHLDIRQKREFTRRLTMILVEKGVL
jgi:hypothetical protein